MKKVIHFKKVMMGIVMVSVFFISGMVPVAYAEPQGTIRIGLPSEVDLLEPNNTSNSYTQTVIHQHVFETLVEADNDMNIKPKLATSWEIAEDGSTLTFQLRKGVKFHDGTSFNAESVKISLDRMRDLKMRGWSKVKPFIKSVDVVDEDAVKINMAGSPKLLLTILAIYGYVESPSAAGKYGKDIGLHPTGTGPYKFVEWIPDTRVVLDANKEYWGGEPKTAKLVFRPVADEQARSAMLKAGDLDVALRPSYASISSLNSFPETKVYEWESGEMLMVWFNMAKAPFDDLKIRQAIAYSIDREGIVKGLFFGRSMLGKSFAAPTVKYVTTHDIYPYNLEKAKAILAELGWKRGKSGFLEKDGQVFQTAIATPSGRYPLDRQVAEAIQAMLKKVGIDVKVIVLESTAFIKTLYLEREPKEKAEFGMVIGCDVWGPVADTPMNRHFNSKLAPPNGANFGFYANPEVDRCIEGGARTLDEKEATELYKKAQDILAVEIPWLPLTAFKDFAGMRKGVTGVETPNPFSHLFVTIDGHIAP